MLYWILQYVILNTTVCYTEHCSMLYWTLQYVIYWTLQYVILNTAVCYILNTAVCYTEYCSMLYWTLQYVIYWTLQYVIYWTLQYIIYWTLQNIIYWTLQYVIYWTLQYVIYWTLQYVIYWTLQYVYPQFQVIMTLHLALPFLCRTMACFDLRCTGTIPELLITSIVRHKNKNRWVGDPVWRSCSLFCVVIFHSSFGLMKYPYTKQFTWSPQGIPPSSVLVITSGCHCNVCPVSPGDREPWALSVGTV